MNFTVAAAISAAGMDVESARMNAAAINLANVHTTRSAEGERPVVSPRLVHEPAHPDADARGFVAYPGIDATSEMVGLMTAVRAYEANVVAVNAAKSMALRALDIGSST
jgi:flagellar basal-body rod protein FlgC